MCCGLVLAVVMHWIFPGFYLDKHQSLSGGSQIPFFEFAVLAATHHVRVKFRILSLRRSPKSRAFTSLLFVFSAGSFASCRHLRSFGFSRLTLASFYFCGTYVSTSTVHDTICVVRNLHVCRVPVHSILES